MIYLLDTNILSDVLRHPQGEAARRLVRVEARAGTHRLATSLVVAAELQFGALKKGSATLQQRIDTLLSQLEVLPLPLEAAPAYARLRLDLERRGDVIGANDMLIAAHALALPAVLVTDNEQEFRRVHGLRVENWMRPKSGS